MFPCPWNTKRWSTTLSVKYLSWLTTIKRLGFSLDEIKDLYDDVSHTPSVRQLTEKIKETEQQLKQLIARRNQLLDWRNSRKEMKTMEKFSIQSLPEIIVASHREVIPNYAAIGPMCYEKIGPEMQRLGCKCPPPGYCFTIEHNKEYTPTDIDIEYCEQVEEMGTDSAIIQFKRLP
ncbi:MAG: MerR family transcriptional regulator, partial [Prevotella sp.]|nr:MerR family transcriptional regulator [Prevotella sp.]